MFKTILSVLIPVTLFVLPLTAQQRGSGPKSRTSKAAAAVRPAVKDAGKRYPSLLWEITGNGLHKPSYLFGTMHVSDKLAFHLGDSFYNAIRSVEVVALETNPETWQDDYSRSSLFGGGGRRNPANGIPAVEMGGDDHMRITSFAIDEYEESVKAALAMEPSMINGLLYRTYGTQMDDFEEDTFLDMYIFQVGRKLGKRLSGVEDFKESEKLVRQAYKDMLLDPNRKRRSYDMEGMMSNPKKLQEAYRQGDLDLLDSLEALTVFSDAFQEKFLYRRNEIQAHSIDSILRKHTLFAGVGAAHLPGKRGVIELLRQKGYTLRPVMMDDRSSQQKESIEKIRMAHAFIPQSSPDSFYRVSIPGKQFYRFTEWSGMDVVQYADMVNGAYYLVTRIKTNGLLLGHTPEMVYRKVDSLLYENIPGKILKKTPITRHGYKGFDILNRTRRGDHQRYQLFVTPFELIVFKMSGNGEYVSGGTEADQFFQSIRLQEYPATGWVKWQPPSGGFSGQWPHIPAMLKDNHMGGGRLEYSAWDKTTGAHYLVMKVHLYNFSYLEEDSFELNLMNESYAFSSFIDKQLSRRFLQVSGYPALESRFKHKDGSYSAVRYIIQGPVYYAVIARYQQEQPAVQRFLESFSLQPFVYPAAETRVDTALHFTVRSPVFPGPAEADDLGGMEDMYRMIVQEAGVEAFMGGGVKSMVAGNDTTGEKIWVNYQPLAPYAYWKDSAAFWRDQLEDSWDADSSFILRQGKAYQLPAGVHCRERYFTDTGSSRMLMVKAYFKDGHLFTLYTLTDTLSRPSSFLESFFGTFTPADTLKGASVFVRKSRQVLEDLLSKDSATARKATAALYAVSFDSTDVDLLQRTIDACNWDQVAYLNTKKRLIGELAAFPDSGVTRYLQGVYWKVKDTADLQHAILNALTGQQTKGSFAVFKTLMLQEPPIGDGNEEWTNYPPVVPGWHTTIGGGVGAPRRYIDYAAGYSNYTGWFGLYDSLALTRTLFPDLLPLSSLEDYARPLMGLLTTLVDSGQLKGADYESYFPKFYRDGKQLLKKQVAAEDKLEMEKVSNKQKARMMKLMGYGEEEDDAELDEGNPVLMQYATLLLPFRDRNPGVQAFFAQLMKTGDRRLLYSAFLLLLRNQQPVPDSLFTKYAALDEYRSELYADLQKLRLTDRFPAEYRNQLAITRSLLLGGLHSYEKLDTLVYLDKLPVSYKGKKGWVYFYKYKQLRDDAQWSLATVGMQPEKPGEIGVEDDEFTDSGERKLEPGRPVKEQLERVLREMLNEKRSSALHFYDAQDYRLYKGYMSEMVKRGRYRD